MKPPEAGDHHSAFSDWVVHSVDVTNNIVEDLGLTNRTVILHSVTYHNPGTGDMSTVTICPRIE